jgi:predicted RNA-binding Zn ribbon-like protein
MTMTVSRADSLPNGLELVVDFVNTRDVDLGTDELSTPPQVARWLQAHGLLEGSERIGKSERARAIELREALRSALLEHNGDAGGHPDAASELERVADRGRLSVRFAPDGSVELAPRADGFAGALAALLVPVAHAAAGGNWLRVKACAADDCQWAFYDRSRNRSGRWCDMAVCGNRTKVRTYRTKRNG